MTDCDFCACGRCVVDCDATRDTCWRRYPCVDGYGDRTEPCSPLCGALTTAQCVTCGAVALHPSGATYSPHQL